MIVQMVVDRNRHGHQIAAAFHPDAEGETLETKLGNVRVCKGDAAYQLTSGEIVSI